MLIEAERLIICDFQHKDKSQLMTIEIKII